MTDSLILFFGLAEIPFDYVSRLSFMKNNRLIGNLNSFQRIDLAAQGNCFKFNQTLILQAKLTGVRLAVIGTLAWNLAMSFDERCSRE